MADKASAAPPLAWRRGDPVQRAAWRKYWISDTIHGGIGALLHYALRLASIDICSGIGAKLGPLLGPARSPNWDRRARENYARLRPDVTDPAAIDSAIRRMWENIGRAMIEFSVMRRLYRGRRVTFVGTDHLRALQAKKRPRIILQLHLGNWELTGSLLVLLQNEPVRQFYQPPRNRFEARIADRVRKQFTEELIPPTPAGVRIAQRFLSKGEGAVVIAGDEYIRGRVQAPAFGRRLALDANLAFAARLAISANAAILPAYTLRTEGAHFEHRIEAPIEPIRTGDRDADIAATAALLDAAIDPIVRAHLDQWLMLHDLRFDRD